MSSNTRTAPRAGLSYAEWEEIGRMLRRRHEVNHWEFGDWLIQGAVLDMDPSFKRSQSITGYSRSFLYALHQTAVAWPPEDRNPNVAWSTHKCLVREPDAAARRALLLTVIEKRWSHRDVIAHFRVKADKPALSARAYENRQVQCPYCQHTFPIKGHKVPSPLDAQALRRVS